MQCAFGRVKNQRAGKEKELWSGLDHPSACAHTGRGDFSRVQKRPMVQESKAVIRAREMVDDSRTGTNKVKLVLKKQVQQMTQEPR